MNCNGPHASLWHLDSDGGEYAQVSLLHPHEDQAQVVQIIPCHKEMYKGEIKENQPAFV